MITEEKKRNIVQIITALPPVIDGVGDYAFLLAKGLKPLGIQSAFIVANPKSGETSPLEGCSVLKLSRRSPEALVSALERFQSSCIVLQYSLYGYHERGCPLWLLEGLRRWKRAKSRRILTVAHELYAFGPPWRTSFWTSAFQRSIAEGIMKLSDIVVTNSEHHAKIIRRWKKQEEIFILPVFSNVGEPINVPLPNERRPRLLTFGQNRSRIYHEAVMVLKNVCRSLDISEIYDIGPPMPISISKIGNIPVVNLGPKDAEEISKIMQDCLAGFLIHSSPLAQSGVFAAFCANGLIPIISTEKIGDGLEPGRHYLSVTHLQIPMKLQELQQISLNAREWYKKHRSSVHAELISNLVNLN